MRENLQSKAIEQSLDQIVDCAYKVIEPPSVLYHYTKWKSAEGILSSQRFCASAHTCMKDKAELVSADSTIIQVADRLQRQATNVAAQALKLFIDGYSGLQITKLITVCLACFSSSRDDKKQWEDYGDDGRGVCLGIRVLDEPGPRDQPSAIVQVDYLESSWRINLEKHFGSVCRLLHDVEASPENLESALLALHRVAAKASIGAKQAQWAGEQEFRYVTLVTSNSGIRLRDRIQAGQKKQCLDVLLRAAGKRIALAEITIGSNQNTEEAKKRLESLLESLHYKVGDFEYPEINVSDNPPETI